MEELLPPYARPWLLGGRRALRPSMALMRQHPDVAAPGLAAVEREHLDYHAV